MIFKRDQRHVELTEAGHVFVRGCKDALTMIEKAARVARTQEEIRPVITIGHVEHLPTVSCRVLLKQLFAQYVEEMKGQYIWSVRWCGLIETV